jgi:hypothetical protein
LNVEQCYAELERDPLQVTRLTTTPNI